MAMGPGRVIELPALPLDMVVVNKRTLPWNTEAGKARAQVKVARRVKLLRGDRPFPDLSTQRDTGGRWPGFGHYLNGCDRDLATPESGGMVAVPTAQAESAARIAPLVEALYCLNLREGTRYAVADAYQEWNDVTEERVVALLGNAARR